MSKHAYLIIAHKCWEQLSILIRLLDDPRNDIYIHIDKKSRISDENKYMLINSAVSSSVIFVDNISVEWGGYSIVKAEMILLNKATRTEKYDYYHLLSGQDLPIKSQDYIHSFFKTHQGKEFITFGSDEWIQNVSVRMKYYWMFQDYAGGSYRIDKVALRFIDRISVYFQKKLGINRLKNMDFYAGAQWFSITDQLARCVVSQESLIRRHFKHTNCSDESLVQIIAKKYDYCNRVYSSENNSGCTTNLRLIDWKRGYPYVFRTEDYQMIMESKCIFARKFDFKIDKAIIFRVVKSLIGIDL